MTARFMHVDVLFFHKRTCHALLDEFGPFGPLAFLSLLAEAKKGSPPGTVTVTSEPGFWADLGLDGYDLGFTMDEFLTFLGRKKQVRRTPLGRALNRAQTLSGRSFNATLTRYGDWQNDVRTFSERERKSRYRAQKARDMVGTNGGTDTGHQVGRVADREVESRENPPTPLAAHNNNCPKCGIAVRPPTTVTDHLYTTHGIDLET